MPARLLRVSAAVALVLLALPARGERVLTLDETLALARTRNRDLQAARARLDQSRVGIEQAWQALLPTVTAQGKYTHNYKEVTLDLSRSALGFTSLADIVKGAFPTNTALGQALDLYTAGIRANTQGAIIIQKADQLDFVLAATVPLLVPSAYPALTAAKKTFAAAESSFAVTEAQILYSAAQGFFTAAGADELETARAHAIQVAAKTRDDARARLEAGVVNRVEVARAELALVRAQQAAREAHVTRLDAYRALATLLLLREPFRVAPAELPAAVRVESTEGLVKQALTLRPEILALDRNLAASDSQLVSALWRWAPTVSAFGNVRGFNYPGFAGDFYSWAVGLQLDWMIYDAGARDSARHLAQAVKRENELRLAQLHDTIADDLQGAQLALDTKRAALDTAVHSVELSRETLDLVRVQHQAGTATQLDLLQAQDSLVAAEVAVAQARFDLALADLALRRTAGTFPGP